MKRQMILAKSPKDFCLQRLLRGLINRVAVLVRISFGQIVTWDLSFRDPIEFHE